MAHAEKFTKGAIFGIANHIERKTENHSNEDIDISKTKNNYSLLNDDSDLITRLNNRLEEVHVYNRKDVNVMVNWVVTLPNELKEATSDEQRQFFSNTHDFLVNRYGGLKNVVSSEIHTDETTPHLHFAFVPVVFDEKRQQERVQANKVIDRAELRVFHDDLHNYLLEKIPGIYQQGVLNDKTIGIDKVSEIKKIDKEIQKEKEIKHELLKEVKTYKKPKEVLDKTIKNSSRSIFGAVQLSNNDLKVLNDLVLGTEKITQKYNDFSKKSELKIKDLETEIRQLKNLNNKQRLQLEKQLDTTKKLDHKNKVLEKRVDNLKMNINIFEMLKDNDFKNTINNLSNDEYESLKIIESINSNTFKPTKNNLIKAKETFEKITPKSKIYEITKQALDKIKISLEKLSQKVQRSKPRL